MDDEYDILQTITNVCITCGKDWGDAVNRLHCPFCGAESLRTNVKITVAKVPKPEPEVR